MRTLKLVGNALFALFICASLTSCGGENNKTKEGEKALDAAVKKTRKCCRYPISIP